MLQGSRVDVFNAVKLRVIADEPVDVRQIKATDFCTFEDREVSIVGKQAVDVVRKRRRYRIWRSLGKLPDETAVLRAGLEHDDWPVIPARIHVEYPSDAPGRRMLVHKRARPKRTKLFSISEENDHVVLQTCAALQSSQCLEHRGHGGAVIRSAWTGRDRIVMPDQ